MITLFVFMGKHYTQRDFENKYHILRTKFKPVILKLLMFSTLHIPHIQIILWEKYMKKGDQRIAIDYGQCYLQQAAAWGLVRHEHS